MVRRRVLALALVTGFLLSWSGADRSIAQTATSATPVAIGPFDAIIQIDDRDVHLACGGNGSPTVLFEVGGPSLDGSTAEIGRVGNDVADYLGTRFCAYDRAGTGRSEADPKEVRAMTDSAADLNAVLGIPELGCPCVVIGGEEFQQINFVRQSIPRIPGSGTSLCGWRRRDRLRLDSRRIHISWGTTRKR